MAFHDSVAPPRATASVPGFAFTSKPCLAVYKGGFQTRKAVVRQLSALFFLSGAPRRRPEPPGAVTPAERQGEARRRRADRRGYKRTQRYGVGALFLFVRIPRRKSRFFFSQLAIGCGKLRRGTKAVIGSLIMINPALIRKNPPTVFCLFAAAARTGQRAQSHQRGKYTLGVFVLFCFSY